MWREKLNKELRYYLEKAIRESYSHKYAIDEAEDKGRAQLWIALAILFKKIADLELKATYLEKALQQFFPKKFSEKEKKAEEQEVEKILKDLLSGKKTEKKVEKRKKRGKSQIKIAKSL